MKVLLYVPSPGLLFSQSRSMLSVSAIKRPISFPYTLTSPPPPPPPTLTLTLPSLFACHSRVTSAWSQATLLLSDLQGMYMIGGSLYLEGLKESARVFIDYDM